MTSGLRITPERRAGILSSWKDDRGFGFITPDAGGRAIFAHISAFPQPTIRPHLGDELTFITSTDKSGREQATLIQLAGDAAKRRSTVPGQSSVSYIAILAFIALYIVVGAIWSPPYWIIAIYLAASLICFAVYAADKSAATAGRWRTSESTLLVIGLLGGWPGAIFAQQRLRHKTRKLSFQLAFWGTVLLNIIAFVVFTSPWFSAGIASLSGN